MELIEATAAAIPRAVAALRRGEVIAYPTETVYGLGVDPFNPVAMERLFEAKGREQGNPVLLIVASPEQLNRVAAHISDRARACMEAFWPGPLSILLPRHPDLPDVVTAGKEKVCVRCPGLARARELCEAFGGPLTSTSANRSGEAPVVRLADLKLDGVSLGLDAGALAPSPPSTILDAETGEILRAGAISREAIAQLTARDFNHL